MQQTSATYRQILSSENHWFETRVVIGESGNLVTETGEQILFGGDTAIVVSRTGPDSGFNEEQLFSVRTDVQMFGDEPVVGKAVSGEIDVEMLSPSGSIQRMGVVIPYVRAIGYTTHSTDAVIANGILTIPHDAEIQDNILVFSPDSGVSVRNSIVIFGKVTDDTLTSEWLQQGKFYIDTREVTHNDDGLEILTLHGYDAMMKAEQSYESDLDWPALDTDIVREIAGNMGVQVDSRTWDIMTDGYLFSPPSVTIEEVTDEDVPQEELRNAVKMFSAREMLGYIAGAYAGVFVMTDVGDLRLVTMYELPKETRYLVDEYGYSLVFGSDRIMV